MSTQHQNRPPEKGCPILLHRLCPAQIQGAPFPSPTGSTEPPGIHGAQWRQLGDGNVPPKEHWLGNPETWPLAPLGQGQPPTPRRATFRSFPLCVQIAGSLGLSLVQVLGCYEGSVCSATWPGLQSGQLELFSGQLQSQADPSDQGELWGGGLPAEGNAPASSETVGCHPRPLAPSQEHTGGSDLWIRVWGWSPAFYPCSRDEASPSFAPVHPPMSQQSAAHAPLCPPSEPLCWPFLLPGIPSPFLTPYPAKSHMSMSISVRHSLTPSLPEVTPLLSSPSLPLPQGFPTEHWTLHWCCLVPPVPASSFGGWADSCTK